LPTNPFPKQNITLKHILRFTLPLADRLSLTLHSFDYFTILLRALALYAKKKASSCCFSKPSKNQNLQYSSSPKLADCYVLGWDFYASKTLIFWYDLNGFLWGIQLQGFIL
jgi:hypothetical protein